jgi:hypothetical protein
VSRHWRPDWSVFNGYPLPRPKVHGGAAVLLLGAVFAGLAGGLGWQWWNSRPVESGPPEAAIEWNAVQAVPTRAPDAEDVAWERRAAQPLAAPVVASPDEAPAQTSSTTVTGRVYVIDGDTFALGSRRIRILGMDAPETHPSRCAQEAQLGNAATEKLSALLASGTVTMSGSGHDQYGRDLKQVFVNGVDVADRMIGAGLARSYEGGKRQGWC